jgi:hypothetical protein
MQKDFDGWNEQKKSIHDACHAPLYHERDIRWCHLGTNLGFEQDGTGEGRSRPVLILKGFSREVCIVLPLTTSQKKDSFHFPIGSVEGRPATAAILNSSFTAANNVQPGGIHPIPNQTTGGIGPVTGQEATLRLIPTPHETRIITLRATRRVE